MNCPNCQTQLSENDKACPKCGVWVWKNTDQKGSPTSARPQVRCAECGSDQLATNKRGYSVGDGIMGTLLTGNLFGMIFGSFGSDKIVVSCLNCGNTWTVKKG